MSRALRLIVIVTVPLALGILVATLMPTPRPPPGFPTNDKVQHFLAFGALCFPAALLRPRWALWIVAAAVAYGYLIEVLQPYFGRDYDLKDLLADGIGAVAGVSAGIALHLPALWLWRRLRRSEPQQA